MLLIQLVEENGSVFVAVLDGLVSMAVKEVDWRWADAKYPLAWHLDQELGTFAVWRKKQKDLSRHRYLRW